MKMQVCDGVSLSFGLVLSSPVWVMILSLVWAMLTPIDVEGEMVKTTSTINRVVLVQGATTSLEFSEPLWTISGHGWVVGFERKATCFVFEKRVTIPCLRYGGPIFEANLIAMYRPYREAERQQRILEEATKNGQRI